MYLIFSRDVLRDVLDNMPLMEIRGLWFKDGKTPAHFSSLLRYWLDIEYTIAKLGATGCPVLWPQRSPDLTPLEFFLWGHLKNRFIETQLIQK